MSFDCPDLNYPVDIRRKIDRKWQRYSASMRTHLANDHKADGGALSAVQHPGADCVLYHDRTHAELMP